MIWERQQYEDQKVILIHISKIWEEMDFGDYDILEFNEAKY